MPFGLCNAPTTFMSIMNNIFRPFLDDFLIVYLDNILVFSKTWEEHVKHVKQVLEVLKREQLIASPLHDLTSLKQIFQWEGKQQKYFYALKEKIYTAPILDFPYLHKPFGIETDASKRSPFETCFGYLPKSPLYFTFDKDSIVDENSNEVKTMKFIERIQLVHQAVQEKLEKSQGKYKA